MTQIFQFRPSTTAPFQFQPTLDGQQYNVIVTWNISAQRWYINVYTQNRVLVVCTPIIVSPDSANINLLFGYFFTEMVFRASSQQFETDPEPRAGFVLPGSKEFIPPQSNIALKVVTGASMTGDLTLQDPRAYIAMDVVTGASVSATLTAAVFATWNSSDKSANVTLSGGALTAATSTGGGARATVGKNTGKWVWEITYNTLTSDSSDGTANATEVITGAYQNGGVTVNTTALQVTHGIGGYHNAGVFTFAAGAAPYTVMYALDADARSISVYHANVLLGTYPTIPTGAIYPLFAPYNTIAALSETLNAGQSAFVNNVPAGYNQGLF